jgi:ubiquitin-protein ligase
MMSAVTRTQRILSEAKQLELEPPPGISAWPLGDSMTEFEAGLVCSQLDSSNLTEKQQFKAMLIRRTVEEFSN